MSLLKLACRALACAAAVALTVSCEGIADPEDDCTSYVQFVYKQNPARLRSLTGEGPDAFPESVGYVHLYLYDAATGAYLFDSEASGPALATGSFRMALPADLPEGDYRLVAWCMGAPANEVFEPLSAATAAPARESLGYRVRRNGIEAWHSAGYNPENALFYGELTAHIEGKDLLTVELMKDTNDISVWVQYPAEEYDPGNFEVLYREDNGSVDAYNAPMAGDELEYLPYRVRSLDVDADYNGETLPAGALIAHLSTARIMASHAAGEPQGRLEIRDKSTGEVLFGVPLVAYLLEMRNDMFARFGDQEYLDCEDTYNCSFFLMADGSGRWLAQRIIINSWVKVPDQQAGF